MRKRVLLTGLSLCMMLSACASQATRPVIPIELTITPKISTNTVAASSTPEIATTNPPNCQPIIIQTSEQISPIFAFLKEDTLMVQVGDNSVEAVGDFPGLGVIKDALLNGPVLYLLREQGIQRIHLTDCSSDTLLSFEEPILWGGLTLTADNKRVYYFGIGSLSSATIIGYYDLVSDDVHTVLSYSDDLVTLQLIGGTEDGKGLYVVPHGQDPQSNTVWLVDIEQGVVSKELPVQIDGHASLAPDSRLLATDAWRNDSNPQERKINIYDLPSLPLTTPRVYTLPNAPSDIGFGDLLWSPDSQRLFFMLIDARYEPTTSFGLWSLDVETGLTNQVTMISDPTIHITGISPDGTWILLRPETQEEANLVNTDTGETRSFPISSDAILAGWQ